MYGLYTTADTAEYQAFFRKYNSDWSIDTTFGTSGTLMLSPDSFSYIASPRNIIVEGDYLYAIGSSMAVSGGKKKGTLYKINIDTGTLDTTFGTSGELETDPACANGDSSSFQGVIVLDNTFLLRGSCYVTGTKGVSFLVAIKKTGELDTAFNNGKAYYYLGDTSIDQYISSIHVKIETNGAKVYTEHKGVFELYQLSW